MSKCLNELSLRHSLKLKYAKEKLNVLVSGDDYLLIFAPLKLVECHDDGSAKFQWTVEENQINSNGMLHGGYISSVAAFATNTGLYLAGIEDYATADIDVSFLNASKKGDLVTIETQIVNRASMLAFTMARISHDSGRLIATAKSSLAKLKQESQIFSSASLKLKNSVNKMLPLHYAQDRFDELLPKHGFATHLLCGQHLKSCTSRGDMKIQWTVDSAQLNRFKQLDIGLIAGIFDYVSGIGSVFFEDPKSIYGVSVDLSISQHRPCFEGDIVTMQTNMLKIGQTLMFVEAVITNADDKVVATGKQTLMKMHRKNAPSSQPSITSKM